MSAAAIDRRRALTGGIVLCTTASLRVAGAQETVRLRLGARPGQVSVINAGTAPVRLRSKITIEYQSASRWHEVLTEMYLVDEQCGPDPLPDCIIIASGQIVRPPPWRGFSCSGQGPTSCRANVYWGSGLFRFRLTGCDGASFVSEAFRMPGDPAALWQ